MNGLKTSASSKSKEHMLPLFSRMASSYYHLLGVENGVRAPFPVVQDFPRALNE